MSALSYSISTCADSKAREHPAQQQIGRAIIATGFSGDSPCQHARSATITSRVRQPRTRHQGHGQPHSEAADPRYGVYVETKPVRDEEGRLPSRHGEGCSTIGPPSSTHVSQKLRPSEIGAPCACHPRRHTDTRPPHPHLHLTKRVAHRLVGPHPLLRIPQCLLAELLRNIDLEDPRQRCSVCVCVFC